LYYYNIMVLQCVCFWFSFSVARHNQIIFSTSKASHNLKCWILQCNGFYKPPLLACFFVIHSFCSLPWLFGERTYSGLSTNK